MEKYTVMFKSMEQINEFVNLASKSGCDMDIGEGPVLIDAKSLQGLIAVGINKATTLTVHGDLESEMREFIAAM